MYCVVGLSVRFFIPLKSNNNCLVTYSTTEIYIIKHLIKVIEAWSLKVKEILGSLWFSLFDYQIAEMRTQSRNCSQFSENQTLAQFIMRKKKKIINFGSLRIHTYVIGYYNPSVRIRAWLNRPWRLQKLEGW